MVKTELQMDPLRKYKNIYDGNILLMYKGELSFGLITSMIETLEGKIEELEEDRKFKKKFHNVATECIQNLFYHIDGVNQANSTSGRYDSKSAVVMITAGKKHYTLLTSNYIPAHKTSTLKERLDNINSFDPEELRALYKKVLSEKPFSEKGTGGLGFIDIARKTGEKFRYTFSPVNDEVVNFTLQIKMPKATE